MRRLSALLLLRRLAPWPRSCRQSVTLDEVLRIVSESPRVAASPREADAARAERAAAGALPNPSLSFGRSRPAGGERTIFDANSQDQALARAAGADLRPARRAHARRRPAGRARAVAGAVDRWPRPGAARRSSSCGCSARRSSSRRAARRAPRSSASAALVAGRQESGMASRYDLARADAEARSPRSACSAPQPR